MFGKRSGEYALKYAKNCEKTPSVSKEEVDRAIEELLKPLGKEEGENPFTVQSELKETMGKYCGIIREEKEIEKGIKIIEELMKKEVAVPDHRDLNTAWHAYVSLKSLLTVSLALAKSALARKESRGAHTRSDYPGYDEALGKVNIILNKSGEDMKVSKNPLPQLPENLQKIIDKYEQ